MGILGINVTFGKKGGSSTTAIGKRISSITSQTGFDNITTPTTILTGVLPANTALPGYVLELIGAIEVGPAVVDSLLLEFKVNGVTQNSFNGGNPGDYLNVSWKYFFQAIGVSGVFFEERIVLPFDGSAAGPVTGGDNTIDTTVENTFEIVASWDGVSVNNTAYFNHMAFNFKLA